MRLILLLLCFLISTVSFGQDDNWSPNWNQNYESEILQFATCKIEVPIRNKVDKLKIDTTSGTAFIFSFKIDSLKSLPLLVTNNHVIRGGISYTIFLTRKDEKGRIITGSIDALTFTDKSIKWISHPDTSIDLCVIPLMPILKKFSKSKFGYFVHSITDDDIPTEDELLDLKGIENIYMIGYPIGLWDSKNNMPIIRRGITATHPYYNYENLPLFMIDAACFPGSSGSPVLIIDEGTYSTKTSSRLGKRRLFLGVLFSGPIFKPDGEIKIIDIPTRKDSVYVQYVPINLGYCIKSSQMLAFKKIILP